MDLHSLLTMLARAGVGMLWRAYSDEAEAALGPTMRTRLLRALLGQESGVTLIVANLQRTLEPWLRTEIRSDDAVIEGMQALAQVLDEQDSVALALGATRDQDAFVSDLMSSRARARLAAEGAQEVFDVALRALVPELRRLAPRLEGYSTQVLTALLQDLATARREQQAADAQAGDQLAELLALVREALDRTERRPEEGAGSRPMAQSAGELCTTLSAARMSPYRRVTADDVEALQLYRWNVEVSAAAYEGLHLVEVVLRNAIDRALRDYNVAQTGSPSWVFEPAGLVELQLGDSLEEAVARAKRQRVLGVERVGHDDIVAQLSFPACRQALPRRGKRQGASRKLWLEAVSAGFPQLEEGEGLELGDAVDELRILRNRVAHLEPVLDSHSLRMSYERMQYVLEAVHPAPAAWFVSTQRITQLLRRKPGTSPSSTPNAAAAGGGPGGQ